MPGVWVSIDNVTGAAYLYVTDHPVARTLEFGDLLAVDLDEAGAPVGVEFVGGFYASGDLGVMFVAFPALREHLSFLTSPWLVQVGNSYGGTPVRTSSIRVRDAELTSNSAR